MFTSQRILTFIVLALIAVAVFAPATAAAQKPTPPATPTPAPVKPAPPPTPTPRQGGTVTMSQTTPQQLLPETGGSGRVWTWVLLIGGVMVGLGLMVGRRDAEREG